MEPCKGRNCGCTDGLTHSDECRLEHDAACLGAWISWEAPVAPDPALLALARFGARIVNDYHRGKWGFISADGDFLDIDAADAGVKEYPGAANLAPGIADAIAALLAPDGADQHEGVQG